VSEQPAGPGASPGETLWTVADVAAYLRTSRSQVYHKCAAGDMPCVRLFGTQLRFRKEEIDCWIVQGMPKRRIAAL
jgi:excisionase family DNA binding protein